MSEEPTSDDTPPIAPDTAPPARGWRPRALHFHLSFWTLLSAGLISVFILLASMSATGQVIVLPKWVTQKALAEIRKAVPEMNFTLRRVEFGMMKNGRPMIRLVDLGVKDTTGLDLAQLNGVEAGFGIGAMLMGRFEPTLLRLQGAQMTLRRFSDGTFALTLGQSAGTTGSFASMLDGLDAAFTAGPLATTSRLEANDLTLTLEDARSGRLWQVTNGGLAVTPSDNTIDTTVHFDVFNQTEQLATTELSFRTSKTTSEASLSARFENVAARDIAAQTPALSFLSVIDAPISGALRTSIDTTGAIVDLAGALKIDSGALSPTPGAKPAAFDGAQIYIDFDPKTQRIDFQGASVRSELGTAQAEGQVYLTDFRGAWPNSMIGQITLSGGELNPGNMFEAPLFIDNGRADLRVTLDPFSIEIGQAVIFRGDNRYHGSGKISANADGWSVAIDGSFKAAGRDELLALWPLNIEPGGRDWVATRLLKGEATDGAVSWRLKPGDVLRMTGTFGLRDAVLRPMDTLPELQVERGYVTISPTSFTAVAEKASMVAPNGDVMDASGSGYRLPDLTQYQKTAVIDVAAKGTVRGALTVLELDPFFIFKGSDLGPDMARGQIAASGTIAFPVPMNPSTPIPPEDFDYDIAGTISHVTSDVVVKDKLLVADTLALSATSERVEISGPVRIGQAQAQGTWHLPFNRGVPGEPSIDGTITINQAALSEFGLAGLGGLVTGATRGHVELAMPPHAPPHLTLVSDLAGLAMHIPGTGWTKSARSSGSLSVEADLGDRPEAKSISFTANGLKATGSATTAEGGGLGEARFDRVQLGGWLDAPVLLTGRGETAPIAISLPGGTIDIRKAQLGGSGAGGVAAGARQPLTLVGVSLIVTEGIRISNLTGEFDLAGGLHGTYTGKISGAAIAGTVAQQKNGSAFRITSKNAGAVMSGAGVFSSAKGGSLELILAPAAAPGTYEGDFTVKDTRLVDAPAMAEMLAAVSVVGLIEQLNAEGILFNNVEGRFKLSPETLTLYHASAVGASMGVSLDGYYDMKSQQVDMQGVLSPLYIVNVLGGIVSPREGEGLVGFNFNLTGPAKEPKVSINPLSILLPGPLRDIFRRPAPTPDDPQP